MTKAKHSHYLQYSMNVLETDSTKLVLTRNSASGGNGDDALDDENRVLMHDLRSWRVTSVDSENKRVLCPQRRFYGLILLSHEQGHRKLYFLTHEQMVNAADFLITHSQRFQTRLD